MTECLYCRKPLNQKCGAGHCPASRSIASVCPPKSITCAICMQTQQLKILPPIQGFASVADTTATEMTVTLHTALRSHTTLTILCLCIRKHFAGDSSPHSDISILNYTQHSALDILHSQHCTHHTALNPSLRH